MLPRQFTFAQFLSAEAAKDTQTNEEYVALGFDVGENKPIVSIALTLSDARDLIVRALVSLSTHGDETASDILAEYFKEEETP